MRTYYDPALRPELDAYIETLFVPEDAALRFAREEAEREGLPAIHIQPGDGRLLELFARAAQARRIVEIGTLAGYSGLWLARALPATGMLYTLEANPRHAAVARRTFEFGGVDDRVQVIEGDALTSLQSLAADAPYDMVFIDADKEGYPAYLDWAVENLRPGGVIAAHNALRHGQIITPRNAADAAMRQFNEAVARHDRLSSLIVNIGDGMLVAVLKAQPPGAGKQ